MGSGVVDRGASVLLIYGRMTVEGFEISYILFIEG